MANSNIHPLTWCQLWWVHFTAWKLIFESRTWPPAATAFWSFRGELRPSSFGIKSSVLSTGHFPSVKTLGVIIPQYKRQAFVLFYKRGRFPSSQTGGCGGSPANLCRLANHPKASPRNSWRTDQTPVTSSSGTSDPAGVALMRQEITTL